MLLLVCLDKRGPVAGTGCDSCADCLQIFSSAVWFLFSFFLGVVVVVRVQVTSSVWRGGHGVWGDR